MEGDNLHKGETSKMLTLRIRFVLSLLAVIVLMPTIEAWGESPQQSSLLKELRKTAEQGDAEAQFFLGLMYYGAELGLTKDYKEAIKWYRKAAEQDYAMAQYNLGFMYSKGFGVIQSGTAAADWFYKAGMTYLRDGKKEDALRCVEVIQGMAKDPQREIPNSFLADKLMKEIYK